MDFSVFGQVVNGYRGLQMSNNNVQCYEFGNFQLDLVNYRLVENGEPVPLTQKSFELLHHLIANRGRVLRKDELLDALWEGNFVEEANLTQHIYMLRKALKLKGGDTELIETIPKTGYRFVADVRTIHDSSNREADFGDADRGPADQHRNVEPGIDNVRSDSPIPTYANRLPKKFGRRNAIAAGSLISVCALLILGVVYFAPPGLTGPGNGDAGSIAVLPFRQISGVQDEKLGLGIADVIIAKLANLENLAVRPTTSIIRYSGDRSEDLFDIGQKLNVEYLLEGSIQRENGTVRVTTQLYSVAERKQVWTETFDEEYTDVFSLQDAISERVAQKVAIGFAGKSRDLPIKQYTRNADAYQAYSTGLSYWSQHSKVGFESAIPHFQRAIDRDPHFALPYAYLADTYGHYTFLEPAIAREKALRLGEEMANKALKLDPECAEAMSAKALIYASRKRGAEAFELMKTSLSIKPNDAHARHRIAWMYANRGDLETALKEMKRALELDPQSVYLNLYIAHFLYLAKKPSEAIEYCEKTLKIDPGASSAKWRKLQILEFEGKYQEVEEKFENALKNNPNNWPVKVSLGRILAKLSKREQAREILRESKRSDKGAELAFFEALAHIALDEKDSALERLEAAVRGPGVDLFILRYEPNLDPLRSDPRFSALLRDLEVSEGWKSEG